MAPALPPLTVPALALPGWVRGWLARRAGSPLRGDDARMALVIGLAAENARRGSGGPFGAAVFERRSGRLVAAGVNCVTASGLSWAHAEMVAIALAQRARGGYDLGARGLPAHELVTSSEPCAMCFGATPWSGVARLVCGARAADAEAIGFDEGPKPRGWVRALAARGIEVVRDVRRAEAVAALRSYGGPIY
ncbi:MAG: tRNA-specific adenosine deaminase [Proteobacteria bacterium]|nr:MAG: tRNA-specific adenosine deaminase [Pseudomonadota bacterium]